MHPPSDTGIDTGIDIGIVTRHPDAMLGFYRDLLGLDPAGEAAPPGGRIIRLRCGASLVKLFIPDRPPADQPPAPVFLARTGLHYVTIRVADIRRLLDACRLAGVNVLVPPVRPRPGLLAAIIADPDGNPVELMQTMNEGEEA